MTADNKTLDRIWYVIDKVGICMMTTRFEGGLRALPLEARPNRKENVIWFLTDRRGLKDDEVQLHPDVCLTYLYPKEKSENRKVTVEMEGQLKRGAPGE